MMSEQSAATFASLQEVPNFREAIKELVALEVMYLTQSMRNALEANQVHLAQSFNGAIRSYEDLPATIAKYAATYEIQRF
jgi:hypothetical protein